MRTFPNPASIVVCCGIMIFALYFVQLVVAAMVVFQDDDVDYEDEDYKAVVLVLIPTLLVVCGSFLICFFYSLVGLQTKESGYLTPVLFWTLMMLSSNFQKMFTSLIGGLWLGLTSATFAFLLELVYLICLLQLRTSYIDRYLSYQRMQKEYSQPLSDSSSFARNRRSSPSSLKWRTSSP